MNKEATYLKIKNLNKSFGQFTALEAVSIDIQQGDFVCFLGPSGCGKTTPVALHCWFRDPNKWAYLPK